MLRWTSPQSLLRKWMDFFNTRKKSIIAKLLVQWLSYYEMNVIIMLTSLLTYNAREKKTGITNSRKFDDSNCLKIQPLSSDSTCPQIQPVLRFNLSSDSTCPQIQPVFRFNLSSDSTCLQIQPVYRFNPSPQIQLPCPQIQPVLTFNPSFQIQLAYMISYTRMIDQFLGRSSV